MDLFGGGRTSTSVSSSSTVEDKEVEETSIDENVQSSSKGTKMSINLKSMEEELQRTNAKQEPGE